MILLDFQSSIFLMFISGKDPFIKLILPPPLSISLSQGRKNSSFFMVGTMKTNHGWGGN
jgi:hypothetical protein